MFWSLTICLLFFYFVSAAGCYCFDFLFLADDQIECPVQPIILHHPSVTQTDSSSQRLTAPSRSSTTSYHGQTVPTKRRKKHQQNDEAESHKWLKTHNTMRTKTGIEGILKHSITGMCSHGTFRDDAEIEYSYTAVHSVFLKTLAYWKVADVVTIPDSLGLKDTDVTDLALSGKPDVLASCQERVLHKIIDLLNYSNSVENTIFGMIGDFIRKLEKRNPTEVEDDGSQDQEGSQNQHNTIIRLSTLFKKLLEKKYKDLIEQCGCQVCQRITNVTYAMGNGLHCCKINPEMVALSNLFRNVSTTSLNRFKEISKSVSSQQTLWVGKYRRTFAPPSHFLEAAKEFSNSFDSVVVGHIRPPAVFLKLLSSFFTDSMVPFRIVPKNALTFSDGDGGTLNQEMARLLGIPSVQSDPRISFRQWGVDAPEWHTRVTLSQLHGTASYRTVRTFDPGQDASLFAQRTLQRASNVYLQYSQRKDCYNRLLVRVLVDIPDREDRMDLAVLLLESGLTFFYPYAAPVREYYDAWMSAQEAKRGLFQLPKEALETILPWHMRQKSPSANWKPVRDEGNKQAGVGPQFFKIGQSCELKNNLLFVAKSSLQDAGDGVWLVPRTSAIRRGTLLCVYGYERVREHTGGDYVVDLDNGECIDGFTVKDLYYGPMINDKSFGMIMEKLSTLSLATLAEKFWPKVTSWEKDHSNTIFYWDNSAKVLYVKTSKTIEPSTESIELYRSYSFEKYWCKFLGDLGRTQTPENLYHSMKKHIDLLQQHSQFDERLRKAMC